MTKRFSQSSLNLDHVLREIKAGKVRPCYLFWGEEEFLIQRALKLVTESLVMPEDRVLNVVEFDGSKLDMSQVLAEMYQPSLISGRKVVIIKKAGPLFRERVSPGSVVKSIIEDSKEEPLRAARSFLRLLASKGITVEALKERGLTVIPESWWSELKDWSDDTKREWLLKVLALYNEVDLRESNDGNDMEVFIDLLRKVSPYTLVVVMSADSVDSASKLYRAFCELGVVLAFPKGRSENEKMGIIRNLCEGLLRKEGKAMDDDAWRALGERTGFDPGIAMGEVEKLILYTGDKKWITAADFDAIPTTTREDHIYNLTVALLNGQETRAIIILNALLDRGEAILRILGGIIREVRSILYARVILDAGVLEGFDARTSYEVFKGNYYPRIKDFFSREGSFEPLKQHPFAIYNSLKHASRLSKYQLLGVLERLMDIDIQLKTSAIDGRFLIERFLMTFSRLQLKLVQ
ncbi:MAG: hypothetical protein N2317_00060 [Syntrophales bacterium]|nr:hypothetical protein [Syntrophales bacterium]